MRGTSSAYVTFSQRFYCSSILSSIIYHLSSSVVAEENFLISLAVN
jgi:hypothetical protein